MKAYNEPNRIWGLIQTVHFLSRQFPNSFILSPLSSSLKYLHVGTLYASIETQMKKLWPFDEGYAEQCRPESFLTNQNARVGTISPGSGVFLGNCQILVFKLVSRAVLGGYLDILGRKERGERREREEEEEKEEIPANIPTIRLQISIPLNESMLPMVFIVIFIMCLG